MIVSRIGTFELDGETVTGFFVSATIDELRAIPHNPLLSRVELHPLDKPQPRVVGQHWAEVACERIRAGEPEREVMADYGWEPHIETRQEKLDETNRLIDEYEKTSR